MSGLLSTIWMQTVLDYQMDDLKIGQYRELKPFEVKKLLLAAKGIL